MRKEELLVKKLADNNMTISTAESCTGGLLSATIVNVSGASAVFNEGYVTYADESKMRLLNVEEKVIKMFGAVSAETAEQMARGCAKNAGANIGLSTTGIAGPGGGTEEKPVGLVYVGCYCNGKVVISRNIFNGDREQVRRQAVEKSISMAIDCLM